MTWLQRNYSSILSLLTTLVMGVILIIVINILNGLRESTVALKESNDRQTRYIQCLLAAHGESQLVDTDVETQCDKMANNITLQDVTKPQPIQSPNPDTQITNTRDTHNSTATPTPPQRSFISPAVDGLNKVIKGTVCKDTPLGKVCI